MRPKLAKDNIRIDKSFRLDVLVRLLQSPMQRGAVLVVEPVSRIERQELDLRALGQIGRLIDDESSSLHPSLQRHTVTVALQSWRGKPP